MRGDFEQGDTIYVDLEKELNENGVEEEMLRYSRIEAPAEAASEASDESDEGEGGEPQETEPVATS